jgi:capsular exopolysaccharide synthesis family protein
MNLETQAMTPFDSFGDPSADFALAPAGAGFGGGADGAGGPRQKGLATTIHRALRGRYWIALPLAALFGAAGAYFGWKSQKPIYKSDGSLVIQYQLDSPFLREPRVGGTIPLYEEFLSTQTYVITSRKTVDQALQDKEWQDTGRGDGPLMAKAFAENVLVDHPRQTQAIHVVYTDLDPHVAGAGTRSLIRAYEKVYNAADKQTEQMKLSVLDDRIKSNRNFMLDEKRQISNIAAEYGTEDFDAIYQNKVATFNKLDHQLSEAKFNLALLESKSDPSKMIENLTPEQIGMLDNVMARKLETAMQAESDLKKLQVISGDRNPRVQEAKKVLEIARDGVESYAKQYKELNLNLIKAGAGTGTGPIFQKLTMSADSLKSEIASLTDLLSKAVEEMKTVGNKQREINNHRDKIKDYQTEIANLEHDRSTIMDENRIEGRLKIISYGDDPLVPFKDNRKKMAAGGLLGGAAFPLLICILLGFLDKRYRYSDEAEGADGMPPLLGILPTLPDRLSDPEQAAVAAHCIHQLRIMLQVNGGGGGGGGAGDRKVYMITSASAGDGKTSLTMALGLSFAASGSRTLVVDCDMVGQGLTTRLKARNSPGLLEALGAGTLNQRVKKTTTPNLFILPIGGADSAHAGSLSPASIRKLLNEARRVFDVVIIDTGPILGSLEAAVVGAAVDAVVLTISRGQHQPLVERSVRQLRQIGAHVAGLVFNRAEKRDFERSVTSSSIRSISLHPLPQRMLISEGAEESRFGPLARSVASFMPGSSNLKELPAGNAVTAAQREQSTNEIRVEVAQVTSSDDTAVGATPPASARSGDSR